MSMIVDGRRAVFNVVIDGILIATGFDSPEAADAFARKYILDQKGEKK
jgi:hypothetical protein